MRNDYLKVGKSTKMDFLLPAFSAGVDSTLSEEVLPLNYAADCYNYDFSSGSLKEGYGISPSFIQKEGVTAVWNFSKYNFQTECQEDYLMFSTQEGEVYYYPPSVGKKLSENQPLDQEECYRLEGVRLSGQPRAVNYRLYGEDVILICTDSDPMTVWDGVNPCYTVVSSPLITSLAMHYERMFVTIAGQKNAVWFSDDLDPTNWSLELNEGGFIEMMDERGSLNKVISYQNYIYIFRDYGISRLTAYADQTEFAISNLFVSSGRIYKDTVTLCGDRVIFLADDGLYAFDGLSTHKILKKLGGCFAPSSGATAAYVGGKYYLATRLATKDEQKIGCENGEYLNNGLLVYDIEDGVYSISRGFDLRRISGCFGQPMGVLADGRACIISKNGCYFHTPLPKKWSIPKTDLSRPDRVKRVSSVFVYTKYDLTLTLTSDLEQKTVRIRGKKTPQRIPITLKGSRIGASLISYTPAAEVSRPLIRFS